MCVGLQEVRVCWEARIVRYGVAVWVCEYVRIGQAHGRLCECVQHRIMDLLEIRLRVPADEDSGGPGGLRGRIVGLQADLLREVRLAVVDGGGSPVVGDAGRQMD